MKIPKIAVLAAVGGVAYLLLRNSAQLRQDVYAASRTVTQRTGGAIPTLPRSVLPNVTPDPGFGVGVDVPAWLTTPWVPGVGLPGLAYGSQDLNRNADGSYGFSVALR